MKTFLILLLLLAGVSLLANNISRYGIYPVASTLLACSMLMSIPRIAAFRRETGAVSRQKV
ncbi:MAG TPA: hypothetical protein VF593_11085 [Chthoniobacteraceae bacterium]|jgi:hypothetical protein